MNASYAVAVVHSLLSVPQSLALDAAADAEHVDSGPTSDRQPGSLQYSTNSTVQYGTERKSRVNVAEKRERTLHEESELLRVRRERRIPLLREQAIGSCEAHQRDRYIRIALERSLRITVQELNKCSFSWRSFVLYTSN